MTHTSEPVADTLSHETKVKKRPGSKLGVKRGPYVRPQGKLAEAGVKIGKGKKHGNLETLAHGLYFRADKFNIDFRSALGRAILDLTASLMDRFAQPAPAMAQLLAQRCAYKLVRAASYEAHILTGKGAATPTADNDYLRLAGSIRADIQTLWLMAKHDALVDQAPDLKEYLAMLREAAKATPINKLVEHDNPED